MKLKNLVIFTALGIIVGEFLKSTTLFKNYKKMLHKEEEKAEDKCSCEIKVEPVQQKYQTACEQKFL